MVKKWMGYAVLAAGVLALLGWASVRLHRTKVVQTRYLIGTQVTATVLAKDRTRGLDLLEEVFREIERLEKVYSDRRDDSELWRVNHQAGRKAVTLSPELAHTVSRAFAWNSATGGLFDITVGRLEELWGFKGEVPLIRAPEPFRLQAVVRSLGMDRLQWEPETRQLRFRDPGLRLDLGGIAKLEILLALRVFFQSRGETHYLVNLGGDILAGQRERGRAWRIGITHPRDPEQLFARLEVTDRLVLTSGDYFRKFVADDQSFHHILDPRTGYPQRSVNAVTLVMPSDHPDPMPSIVPFLLGPELGMAMIEAKPDIEGFMLAGEQVLSSQGIDAFLAPGTRLTAPSNVTEEP